MSRAELQAATRAELIAYLEAWGFQCYDHEKTSQLRNAALKGSLAGVQAAITKAEGRQP